MAETGGASLLQAQDACAIYLEGKASTQEHFGYTDGFGNPDFKGAERDCVPGQGKLDADGKWEALATGEFLLGYADEAGELPPAPDSAPARPQRHVHGVSQTAPECRDFPRLPRRERQALRGRQGETRRQIRRPLARRHTAGAFARRTRSYRWSRDKNRNTEFTYGADPAGARCPLGAHIRRAHPRDAFGFNGGLVNRRRIMRRGLPYGEYVPEGQPVRDEDERGIIFMVLNASIFRQFEFVQQQWIEYGNDAHQGNDKDPLVGNHEGTGTFLVQGTVDPANPPFLCGGLPNFVELRGGDYFFIPSLTALAMIATGTVDPR